MMAKNDRPSQRAAFLAPLVVAAMAIGLGLPAMRWPASSADEMLLLVDPIRMLHGQLPYQDFFAAYGPAHWWLLEGTYAVASPTVITSRLLGLTVHVLLCLGVYRLTRPLGILNAALSGGIAALVLFYLGLAPFAWITCVALCVWQLAVLHPPGLSRRRALVGGILGALAIGMRPDAALLALLPALPLMANQGRWRSWGTGLAIGSTPLVASLLLTPSGLIQDVLLGRASRGAGQSRLPFLPSDPTDRTLLAVVLLAVVLALLAAYAIRTPWFVSISLLALLSMPQALQRSERVHFLYAALLSLIVLPQVLSGLLRRFPIRVQGNQAMGAAAAALLVLLGTAQSTVRPVVDTLLGHGRTSVEVHHQGRHTPETPFRATALARLLPALDALTTKDSRLVVFDRNLVRPALTDLTVYYLMPHVRQVAYNLEINPGISNGPNSHLASDLEHADIVVLVDVAKEQQEASYPYEKDGPLDGARALERLFCPVAKIDFYRIYTRCDGTSMRPRSGL